MEEKLSFMIFVQVDGFYAKRQGEEHAYIRYNCKPFDTLEAAQDKIKDICLNSSCRMSDFRIFTEFKVR